MNLTINGESVAGFSGLIKNQLVQLLAWKKKGTANPEWIDDDIKVYRFILDSADPEKFADEYLTRAQELREERNAVSVRKMEVAKLLGWEIK